VYLFLFCVLGLTWFVDLIVLDLTLFTGLIDLVLCTWFEVVCVPN
jgi:hypothetical protein